MVFNTSEAVIQEAKKLIGKEIFFLNEHNTVIKGIIGSCDAYQFFLERGSYGIAFNKTEFFFTLQELFDNLKANMLEIPR